MILGPNTLPPPSGPYRWQRIEDEAHGDDAKRAIFASPRTGKTACVAGTLRRRADRWSRALVVAPLRVCPVWDDVLSAAGLPVHRLDDLNAARVQKELVKPWEGVAVVNRDKLIAAANVNARLDAFVADESHNYAGVSTDRARAYRKLARTTPWVRALTGTPIPRHYGSLWGQLQPFGGGWADFTSYEKFAQRFLIRDAMFRSRVLAHINVDQLQAMVLAVASTYRREDWFGPDQYTAVTRHVEMGERAWKLYHELAKEWILSLPAGELTAANAAVRLLRLQQLTSGFVPIDDADGKRTQHLIHQAKIEAVVEDFEAIERENEKLVIFHRFTPEGQAVHDEFLSRYPNLPLFKIDGRAGRDASDSHALTEAFNHAPGAAVIVVQVQSGSEGISLRKGRHLAYLSRTLSLVDDEQSRDRVYEAGQPRTITYYDVAGTVDDFISELLRTKRTLHEAMRNVDREALVYGNLRRKRTA